MTLTFTDGTLRAHAGCNSIGGAFTIEDGEATHDPAEHDRDGL